MKFTINAQTLQTELTFLSGVAEQKNTIPVLQSISASSVTLTPLSSISATDLDVTLSCKAEAIVSKPGSILVPMGKLLAITKKHSQNSRHNISKPSKNERGQTHL